MIASSLARIITGKVKTASVNDAARIHFCEGAPNRGNKNNTKNAIPKRPKTILGTPARVLIHILIIRTAKLSEAHSTRYAAEITPSGKTNNIDKAVNIKVPNISGPTPPK